MKNSSKNVIAILTDNSARPNTEVTTESGVGTNRVEIQVEKGEVGQKDSDRDPRASEWTDQDDDASHETTDLSSYNLTRDMEKRPVKAPVRYGYADIMAYAFSVASVLESDNPKSYFEAVTSKERDRWIAAMNKEIQSLHKNKTWRLVDRPSNQKVVDCKWTFKKKQEATGRDSVRFRARLVARGFTQEEGVDFNEIFSPVVKQRLIRFMLALVTQIDMELEQMDVKTTFLYGELEETIFN